MYIKQVLSDNDIPVYPLPLNTGLVAHLGCGKPVVAFRCDIDALPMTEESGLAYASEYPGRMHACGHDFHTASLLGIALTLRNCLPLQGMVELIFQPAEENMAGARQILQTGILDDVEVIFGLHCCAAYPKGTVISRPGFMNGAVDEFHIDFYGNGAHACRPHQSADSIIMIDSFVQEAQTIVSRNTAPFHPVVVGITRIGSGTVKSAKVMGANYFQIIWYFILPEAKSSMILSITIGTISLISATAQAGTIGAGGIGDMALTYGYERMDVPVMLATIVILVVIVQSVQTLGNYFAKRARNH